MALWPILDVVFPMCPFARVAVRRAKKSVAGEGDSAPARVERVPGGWAIFFRGGVEGEPDLCRIVLRGNGVVYIPLTAYRGAARTARDLSRYRAALPRDLWGGRFVWALWILCDDIEIPTVSLTLAVTLGDRIPDPTHIGRYPLPGPIFFGSRAAMLWTARRIESETGLRVHVRRVWRFQARRARRIRVHHFAASLRDVAQNRAGDSSGGVWTGQTPFHLYEEAEVW